ncbi:MAG: YcaQ family DNA glycosylase [Dehalococcoidia bacterium]|nr:YcaQ family DNA glycosylase [Dehalococcoidia bacterium]
MTTKLSRIEARRVLLAAQGLGEPWPERPATKDGVLATIRRMAALQIDTIAVVARSPYFVLWSRLGEYEPAWLDELLAEGALFEWWAHAACFLPEEEYPLYRRRMLHPGAPLNRRRNGWLAEHRAEADALVAYIRENGPVRSADFERPEGQKGNGWWDWKAEKQLLEVLFGVGELMIARRQNFQRVYDLAERVRPAVVREPVPSWEESQRALLLRTARALGVAKAEWLPGYLMFLQPRVPLTKLARGMAVHTVDQATADDELLLVEVEGWDRPGLVHQDNLELIDRARDAQPERTTLLSPFDPVCWDRERALDLFGFDYRIECYTPASKRRYGYFSLPILHGDALVGRLDAKAHRREGVFEVKALHLEEGVAVSDELVAGLRDVLERCARWHRTPEVVVRMADPPLLREALGYP